MTSPPKNRSKHTKVCLRQLACTWPICLINLLPSQQCPVRFVNGSNVHSQIELTSAPSLSIARWSSSLSKGSHTVNNWDGLCLQKWPECLGRQHKQYKNEGNILEFVIILKSLEMLWLLKILFGILEKFRTLRNI